MAKLFDDNKDEPEIGGLVNNGPDTFLDQVTEADDSIGLVTESYSLVASQLRTVNDLAAHHGKKKLASMEYFISVETYTPILKNIAVNLGYKPHIPSMEDFANPYGTKAAHAVATEGFGEFMKRMWEKLRDLLSRFFKKVTEFFKRITKANLEIDTYDRYIPELIRNIKSKKLKLLDTPKKITSKLPELLGNPGFDYIDDVFLLNEGLRKAEHINNVIYKTIVPNLNAAVAIGLKSLKAELESISLLTLDSHNYKDEINKYQARVTSAASNLMSYITPLPSSTSKLPGDVLDVFVSSLSSSASNDIEVRSLVDSDDPNSRLPKGFNFYTAISTKDNRTVGMATSQDSLSISSEIEPAATVEVLIVLETFYNKYKKMSDPSKVNKAIKDNEDALEALVKYMGNGFAKHKDNLKFSGIGTPTKEDVALVTEFISKETSEPYMDDERDAMGRAVSKYSKPLGELLNGSCPAMTNDDISKELIKVYEHIPELIRDLAQVCGVVPPSFESKAGLSKEELSDVIKQINDIESFVVSVTQTLQVGYRGLGATILSIASVELRYELAKYIYDSGKCYG